MCISTTRLIIATSNVQKRNRVSQVMYIGITSLYRGRYKKILTSSGMRKQPPPFMVTPTGSLSGSDDSISTFLRLSTAFSNTATLRYLRNKKKSSVRRIHKNFIKSIDKQTKVGYTINVGATCDGCFAKLER